MRERERERENKCGSSPAFAIFGSSPSAAGTPMAALKF